MSNALDSSQMGVVKSIVLFFNLKLKPAIFQQKMKTKCFEYIPSIKFNSQQTGYLDLALLD